MHTNHRTISRVLAAAVASTGFAVAPMPAFAASLTCTSSTFTAGSDGSGNIVVNCTSPSTGASCSLTASPNPVPAAGGTVTLTSTNCGTITSLTKSSTQIGTSGSGPSWTDTLAANTGSGSLSFTYTVQGSSGSDSVIVTQSGTGSTPPPPPPGGAISCAGYATTLAYTLPWTAASSVITKGFNNSAIVVASFTTPATGVVSMPANISSAEYGDGKAMRTGSLSTAPCDMTGTPFGKPAKFKGIQTPGFSYQINGASTGVLVLQPSTTYYLNIVNRDSLGNPSCSTSTCNMIIQLTKPFGL